MTNQKPELDAGGVLIAIAIAGLLLFSIGGVAYGLLKHMGVL